jgi:hypothetical protein
MDRTSAQPQVNLGLLRSNSLKFQPLDIDRKAASRRLKLDKIYAQIMSNTVKKVSRFPGKSLAFFLQ